MLNIAISGAGPVGCTIARLLLKSSVSSQINLTIFEKDKSRTSRTSVGGTLDLHPPTGLAAIDAMGLSDSFKRYARYEGEELRMCDQNGVVYMHMTEAPQIEGHEARPEIDRVKLMDVLLGGVLDIAPEAVKWGRQVKEVVPDDKEGQWNVNFEDGSTEGPFDLIIGADGAWSQTRKALTDVEPSYSGICGVSGHIDEETAGDKWEAISSMVGKGNTFSFSYGQSMVAQRMGDGSLKTSFQGRRDPAWIEDIKTKYGEDDEALRKVLLEEYKDWVPEFQQWIKCCTKLWCASLWELPVGLRFEHKKGLTLIGDSAHLMTPFAGEGVNAGMRDALDLFKAIETAIKEKSDLDAAVIEFEESMFERAAGFMADTLTNKNGMFAHDAPYTFFADMVGVMVRELSGHDVTKGWKSWLWWPVRTTAYGIIVTIGSYGAVKRRVKDLFRSKQ